MNILALPWEQTFLDDRLLVSQNYHHNFKL
jgi:hypothetical protein